jgi:hypothetical protein
MTVEHPVRRLLARLCSADTMARVVDPTLADMRFEIGRSRWLGYVSLAGALTLHAATSTPDRARRLWADDEHALARVAVTWVTGALVTALPFVALPLLGPMRNGLIAPGRIIPLSAHSFLWFLVLLPQALVITLPPALFVAWPLTARRQPATARTVRRAAALAVAMSVAMAVLVEWGAPVANQRFRVIVSGNAAIARGESESGFRAIRKEIADVSRYNRSDPGRIRVLQWLQYRYQLRIALICSPIPIAVLALVLGSTRLAGRHPVAVGLAAMSGYLALLFVLDGAGPAVSRARGFPLAVFAWLPATLLVMTAVMIARAATRWPRPEPAR